MVNSGVLILILLASLPVAAQQANSGIRQRAEAELLALHQQDRRAHFQHDVSALLAHLGPQLLDVRDGKVNVMSREDVKTRFAEYFSRADFSAWDDVQPPVVRASDDGRIGWMIVRVRIAYTEREQAGRTMKHDSTMAWMSTYEKRNRKWFMTTVTSTSDEK